MVIDWRCSDLCCITFINPNAQIYACHYDNLLGIIDNIRCSFETGHWTQIPQAFPTLWRMLMSMIQHLRTRLPVHIGFVPVKKPGQETKERNHQSTAQADTQNVNYRNSSANAQQ